MTLPSQPRADWWRGYTVEVLDRGYGRVGYLNDYESCSVSSVYLGASTGTVAFSESHDVDGRRQVRALTEHVLRAGGPTPEVVPVRLSRGDWRWDAVITFVDCAGDDGQAVRIGSGTVTATLTDEGWDWLRKVLAYPNPSGIGTPPMPEYDVRVGPVRTVVGEVIAAAAARFDEPVYVVPPPGGVDTSGRVELRARFTPLDELVKGVLRDAGLGLRITRWLPGDPQPPFGELTSPTRVVEIQQTRDEPWLRWSDTFGGVLTRSVSVDAPGAHTAVVGGQGDGPDRVWTSFTDEALKASLGRHAGPEIVVNATDVPNKADDGTPRPVAEVVAELQQRGREKLAEISGRAAFTFTAADAQPWVYGRDYLEGDLATGEFLGVEVRRRIERVTATDNRAGFRVSPQIGEGSADDAPDTAAMAAVAALRTEITTREAGR